MKNKIFDITGVVLAFIGLVLSYLLETAIPVLCTLFILNACGVIVWDVLLIVFAIYLLIYALIKLIKFACLKLIKRDEQ